jgi:MarR family transcriptional regulator for hemolysin
LSIRYDFEESVGYWTGLASQAFHRAINEELAPHGVTFRQAQVLAWLQLHPELSQTDLAARMMIEPPTLVGILDRMERDGWIARVGCAGDRRKKLIRALPAADTVWGTVAAISRRVRARATAGMGPEEVEQLKALLRKMQSNLGDAPLFQMETSQMETEKGESDTSADDAACDDAGRTTQTAESAAR